MVMDNEGRCQVAVFGLGQLWGPCEAAAESEGDDDFQPDFGQSIGSKGHGRGKCTPCTRILVRPGHLDET